MTRHPRIRVAIASLLVLLVGIATVACGKYGPPKRPSASASHGVTQTLAALRVAAPTVTTTTWSLTS